MINSKSNKRLKVIESLIKSGEIIADIGTDHGILPLMLLDNKNIKKIIATDISKKSLDKLERKLNFSNIDKINLIVSDGLKDLSEPYPDIVVISGMGARLIIKILESSIDIARRIKTFIFQPNTTVDELRVYLHEIGFKIDDEKTVLDDGRYYNIIVSSLGDEKYQKKSQYKYGKILLENRDKNTKDHIESEYKRFQKLKSELKSLDIDNSSRLKEIENEIIIIKEALKYYEDTNNY